MLVLKRFAMVAISLGVLTTPFVVSQADEHHTKPYSLSIRDETRIVHTRGLVSAEVKEAQYQAYLVNEAKWYEAARVQANWEALRIAAEQEKAAATARLSHQSPSIT